MAEPLSDEGLGLLLLDRNLLRTASYGDPASILERMPRPSFEEFTTLA